MQQAFGWFVKSANLGYREAMTNVALAYLDSQGVIKNIQDAIEWFEKALIRSDANAEYHLAKMYSSGVHISP